MPINLCINSFAPPLFALLDQPSINMAATGAGAPVVTWKIGSFNLGTVAGQKIFLEKTKGLSTAGNLPLSNASATNIMGFLKMKEQLMGIFVTRVPTLYTSGVGSSPMNLIHQSPSIPLDIFQRGAHARFGTALADGDTIPEQPWISVALDPANNNADEATFYTRVHENVVVEIVKNFLTPNGWDDLMLQQQKFVFSDITGMKSYDGPTLLKVLLEEIDPTASVKVELHCQAIEGAKLQEHKSNVIKMCKC